MTLETEHVVVPQRTLEDFHGGYSRDKVAWGKSFRARASVHTLEQGMDVYQPSITPHVVDSRDGPSTSMSISYYTSSLLSRESLFNGNLKLRQFGISPEPVGRSRARTAVKHSASSRPDILHINFRRALGRRVQDNKPPYAPTVNY